MTARGRRSRGQGLVEFAIVFPLVALMVFALFDLGRGVFVYNTVAQAARQAARAAIVDQDVDYVRSVAYGAAPSVGLTSADVDVCFKTNDSSLQDCASSIDDCPELTRVIGCLAIVDVHVAYAPMTPFISSIWSSISLSSTSIQPIEYVCPTSTQSTCP